MAITVDPQVSNFSNVERGSSREQIGLAELTALRASGALVPDERRERPRYFDGRFLAARDLIRDQQYFLTREADLGPRRRLGRDQRAAGEGR